MVDIYITGLMPTALAKPTALRRTMNTPRRLTTQQASEWLGLPEATLRWYRHRGDRGPRSYCLGSRIFYDLDDVVEWAELQKTKTVRGGVL
jgi:Helix-turn-helix domain